MYTCEMLVLGFGDGCFIGMMIPDMLLNITLMDRIESFW